MKSLEDIIRNMVGLEGAFDTKIKNFNKFYRDKKDELESIRTQHGLASRKKYNEEFMMGIKKIEELASEEAKKADSKFIYPGKEIIVLPSGAQYVLKGNVSLLQEIYNYSLKNGADAETLFKIKQEIAKAIKIITLVIIDSVILVKTARLSDDFNYTMNSELHNLNVLLDKKLVAVDSKGNTELPDKITNASHLLNKYYATVIKNQEQVNSFNNAIDRVVRSLESKKDKFETSNAYLAKKAEDEYLNRKRFRK